MSNGLSGKRVAILATDGFELAELVGPKEALENAGAKTTVISLKPGVIRSWHDGDWGESIRVDKTIDQVAFLDFDSLVLPGGVMNPDKLRLDGDAVDFARKFVESGKAVGAICHGPWLLVEADVVAGRRMTSWPSLRTDLVNAGAQWMDSEVVVDEGLVTSRKLGDVPAFNTKLIEEIKESRDVGASRRYLI